MVFDAQHRSRAADSDASNQFPTPGRRTLTDKINGAPAETARDSPHDRALAATVETKDIPELEASVAEQRVLSPASLISIRYRATQLRRAARNGDHTDVYERITQLLARHDANVTPAAKQASIDSWLREDRARHEGRTRPAHALGFGADSVGGMSASAGAPSPAPLPHTSREVKVEKEGDTVSGAVVVTVEQGKTGVGGDVGPVDLKTLEATTSIKLNGFVTKLEVTLLAGELDFDILDAWTW